MSNSTTTRPVIRASVPNLDAAAEFLSMLFGAPVTITSAGDEVSTPAERHLVMIISETGSAA